MFDAGALGGARGSAGQMLCESFFKPRRERRAAVGFNEDVHHLMEEDLGQAALGLEACGLVQVNGTAAGDGGEGAGRASGVAEEIDGRILAEGGAAGGVQGGAAAGLEPGGPGSGQGNRGSIASGEKVERFRTVAAPGKAARGDAGDGAGEIKGEDFAEISAVFRHFDGAFLAQTHAMARASAAEFGGLLGGFHVIKAAAENVPSERPANGEVEGLGVYGAAVGAEGQDAARGAAAPGGEEAEAGEAQDAVQDGPFDAGGPGGRGGAAAPGVLFGRKVGAGEAGPDFACGSGAAAAVGGVKDEGGRTFPPENDRFCFGDSLLDLWLFLGQIEPLAMRSGAEIESFIPVAAGVDADVGAGGDGHGFEGFRRGGGAHFAGGGGGDDGFDRKAGDSGGGAHGGGLRGGRKREREQDQRWPERFAHEKRSAAMGAAPLGPRAAG